MNELLEKYPELKGRNGIDIQQWKICPIGVGSQHEDGSVTITESAAKKFAKQIEHTPLMYAETDSNLPNKHRDKFGNRKVIGSGIKGYIEQDENGVEWLVGDYAVYTDTDSETINKIKKFKNDIGASYEIHQSLRDEFNNVHDGGYSGTSVTGKNDSAYRHEALLIADKTGTVTTSAPSVVAVDDVLKDIIGNDYKSKVSDLEATKIKLEADIEALRVEHEKTLLTKDESIEQLKKESENLRELIDGFASL